MSLLLQRLMNRFELTIFTRSEVPESVPACDHDDVMVHVAKTDLRAKIISKRVLYCLHTHALGLVPLPDVNTLIRLSISETGKQLFSVSLTKLH